MTGASDPLAGREIILEWTSYGDIVRVAAVDAATGTEASASGPAATPRADLERLALRKLARKLAGGSSDGSDDGDEPPTKTKRRGKWV